MATSLSSLSAVSASYQIRGRRRFTFEMLSFLRSHLEHIIYVTSLSDTLIKQSCEKVRQVVIMRKD